MHRKPVLVPLLLVLMGLQLTGLALRQSTEHFPAPAFSVFALGDTLPPLNTFTSLIHQRPGMASPQFPAILLAFSVTCGHCYRVAPEWSAIIDSLRPTSWYLISRDPELEATSFIGEFHLEAPLLLVEGPQSYAGTRLTALTPWVYVLDDGGAVRFSASGWVLRQAAAVLDSLRSAGQVMATR